VGVCVAGATQWPAPKKHYGGTVSVYGVPYSEHSSFGELEAFVRLMRPRRVVPTVNMGSAPQRDAMQQHFRRWLAEGR
jgi:DNA cross-link repair 1A protein